MALTSNGILDAVEQRIHDNSDEMRTRLLSWLNDAIQAFWIERDWKFLQTTASLSVSSSQATLPADYGRFVSCKYSTDWYLHARDQYTDEEAFDQDAISSTDGNPTGFITDSTTIYFKPSSADVTATLKYCKTIPVYADNETTLLPDYMRNLFVRTLMDAYYEFEADERGMVSIQLNQGELDKVKAFENRTAPIPKREKYLVRHF